MNTHMNSEQEKDKDNPEEMQTVVSSYVTPNLIEQADNRLIDIHNGFQNDTYNIDYQYNDISKRLEEKIDVEDDKEEELVITDDVIEENEKNESRDGNVTSENLQGEVRLKNDDNKNEFRGDECCETSWHPHVYGKPPKKPTPHTIEYILGLNGRSGEPKRSVSQLINVKRNFDVKKPFSMEKSIQVETDVSDRKFNLSVHKNKLQEQLLQRGVRTSECEVDKVQYRFKDEEQPLNLCVPKSKDSGWSSTDEEKICKGQL
jgi:hypothetical protein